jgi:alpha-beta hydrolase superfamily lysophospholipase
VSARSLLAAGLARTHRVMPRVAGYVHTAMFIDTRGRGSFPDDVCPLGAHRVELTGVPRVAAAYVWGGDEPTVLALHGWGADSTAMLSVVNAAVADGASAICFDAPGHGVSPGSQATITEYAHATRAVLQRFPSIHTVVAHSLGSIAAVWAVSGFESTQVRNMLLLAPTCSLSAVLERWAAERELPRGVITLIYRELERRDGVPVSHWDIPTLGLPPSVQLRILHDPEDDSVPLNDSYRIAASIPAVVAETTGTGHDGILGSEQMRAALTACLRPGTQPARH